MKSLNRTLALLLLLMSALYVCADEAVSYSEEIIVTADFYDAGLMGSSTNVTVVDEEEAHHRAAQHIEDVLSLAPNVSWSAGASRGRFVQVRGIGDLEQYAEPKYYPSVGIMLDDIELGATANGAMLFDVSQTEVLRGPQGTSHGAGGYAGLVKMRSNDATDVYEGYLVAGAGNYSAYNVGAVLSGPLSETVAARIAVQQNESDGYIDNRALGDDDLAGFDELTMRAKLKWTPSELGEYEITVFRFDSENGYDTWSLENNRNTQSDDPGVDEQQITAFSGKGRWMVGDGMEVEVVVTDTHADLLYRYDVDWINPNFCVTYTCSFGHDTAQEIFARERDQTTWDIRVYGGGEPADGRSRFVAGIYGNESQESLGYAYPSFWYGDYSVATRYDTERLAVYGRADFPVADDWVLAVGARSEHFEDDYADGNGTRSDNDERLFSFDITLNANLSDSTLVYGKLASAEKPGGINVAASSQVSIMSPVFQGFMVEKLNFDAEQLTSFELGVKSSLADGKLDLRAALFHSDRKDAQLENWMWDNDAGLWIGYLDSTSDVTNYGLEMEADFSISGALEVYASLGILRTEVDRIGAFDLDVFDFVVKRDRDQAKSPRYQFTVGMNGRITERLSVSVSLEGRDESFYGYYHNGRLDAYELVNASLAWENEDVSVRFWVRNLTDEDYATHGLYFGADPRDDFAFWSNRTYKQFGAPRTYGVEARYAF